ncbi:hypothetical protein DYU05_05710 [Mucilaginibacter terrenus]|uniref:Lipocalin-like domain-containing protein n=1 Tax=Mucilaginibacter terrenus TaxID=2482727 RepID=A0A3E2NVR1_9SPHI|nr:hypothetical protein [Mucilaginibacter terrenus]RFZ85098.1 hypothetical protein DYU05_05710 [Mucilaginibacter terrenus]
MKANVILVLLTALLSASCTRNANTSKIEGAYISQAKGEYAVNDDTLEITSLHTDSKTYSIVLKTGFKKIRDGKTLAKQHKQEHWTASWDENKKTLIESELGRQIEIKSSTNELIWNNLVFKKTK